MTAPSRSTIAMTSAIRSFCSRLDTPKVFDPVDLDNEDTEADMDVENEAVSEGGGESECSSPAVGR